MGDVVAFPGPSPDQLTDPAPDRAPDRLTDRPEPLWREQVGRTLREARLAAELRLVDVAERAGVSPQYLSELERGLKDPSSEILAAVSGALGLRAVDVASRVVSTQVWGQRPGAYDGPVCLAV